VWNERDSPGRGEQQRLEPSFDTVSAAGILVEFQDEPKDTKSAFPTSGSSCSFPTSSSSAAVERKEEKLSEPQRSCSGAELASARQKSHISFEDRGICNQLSLQSMHIEALLERLVGEVEQIRADGSRLANGLLGGTGSAGSRGPRMSSDSLDRPLLDGL